MTLFQQSNKSTFTISPLHEYYYFEISDDQEIQIILIMCLSSWDLILLP